MAHGIVSRRHRRIVASDIWPKANPPVAAFGLTTVEKLVAKAGVQ
jgi:hypothetical protein